MAALPKMSNPRSPGQPPKSPLRRPRNLPAPARSPLSPLSLGPRPRRKIRLLRRRNQCSKADRRLRLRLRPRLRPRLRLRSRASQRTLRSLKPSPSRKGRPAVRFGGATNPPKSCSRSLTRARMLTKRPRCQARPGAPSATVAGRGGVRGEQRRTANLQSHRLRRRRAKLTARFWNRLAPS